ncbi:MAG: insulinase family protein [Ruminococcaceae bacterium]|nr:insulinase family protein [Oscillospiraceae bacterium]
MKLNERLEVIYIPTDKFKTGGINIAFCDNLCRERAYKNALIPMILCRGTKKHPTSKSISEEFQKLYSADFATSTEKKGEIQVVQFAADFIEDKYAANYNNLSEQVVDMLLDIITNPATNKEGTGFKEEYFTQEVKNNNDFIKGMKNDKRAYAMFRCTQVMCEDENYALYEMGSVEDSQCLSPENLYQYYREYFLKKTAVKIFVCCKEEPVWLYEKLKKIFMGTDTAEENTTVKLDLGYCEKIVAEPKIVKDTFDVTQGKLNIGFRVNVKPDSDEFYALAVCNGILGAGPGSKLFRNVREKNSLAYYAASRLVRTKGLLIAYSGIEPENYEKTKELIFDQLKEIQQGNVTRNEYEDTIKMFVNSYNAYKDTVFSIMDFHLGEILMGTDLDIDGFVNKIKSVTIEDVIKVSHKIIPDTVYFLGPEEEM